MVEDRSKQKLGISIDANKDHDIIGTVGAKSVTYPTPVSQGYNITVKSGQLKSFYRDENGVDSDKVDVPTFTTNPATVITGVTLSDSTLALQVGGTKTLSATVAPVGATVKTVSYTSSEPTVATVSTAGVVNALKVGKATITATSDVIKTAKATSALNVEPATVPVASVTLTPTTAKVKVDATTPLTGSVVPTNATDKAITYKSSAPEHATVSETGVIKGVAIGEAIITATSHDGSKTATSTITVEAVE